jgi:hypothetical protein
MQCINTNIIKLSQKISYEVAIYISKLYTSTAVKLKISITEDTLG